MMDFNGFEHWAFLGICSGGVVILWQLKESVSKLNGKIEVLIVQHQQARDDINDHEERLRYVEQIVQ